MVRFDFGPLVQGQMRIAKTKIAYTVNDLFSASALVTAPYLFSKQYTWQLLVGDRSDSDSAQSRLVIKGY